MARRTQRTPAQPVPVGLTVNRVQVGVRGPLLSIDPEQPQLALQDAVDILAQSGGGELLVQPGHLPNVGPIPYAFPEAVRIDVPDVRLRFAPGATLDFAGADALFHVRAPRFSCESAHVVHQDLGSDQRSCFLLGDPAQPGSSSDEASFEGCHFALTQSSAGTLGFSAIRVEGDERAPGHGLRVEGCTFDFAQGIQSNDAWLGDDHFGLCAVRVRNVAACTITSNRFRGPGSGAKGHVGPLVLLDNAPDSCIASNVFTGLDLSTASGIGGSALRITTHGAHPGHGTQVAGNVACDLDARHVVELVGTRFDLVQANCFDGIGPQCHAALAASGPAGQGLVVSANVFRDIVGGGGPAGAGTAIRLDGVSAVTVSANAFGALGPGARPLVMTPGTCSDVHVAPAQSSSSREA